MNVGGPTHDGKRGRGHGNQFLRKRLENDFQGTHLSVKKIVLQNLSGLKIPQVLSQNKLNNTKLISVGRGTEQSLIAVAHSKSSHEKPGFLRIELLDILKHETLQRFVDQHITPNFVIECDGFSSYKCLKGCSLSAKTYSSEDDDLKWVHIAISNLKAFLIGTYHGRVENLQPYLDEFCFRYNRRQFPYQLFSRLAAAVSISCTLLS